LYCYIVANCVSINYYLISEKGYEKIQQKLRGYEWVERLRTTALVAKKLSPDLDTVVQDAVKVINFMKSRALNIRLFAKLCDEMESDYNTLLLRCEVRWLSLYNYKLIHFSSHSSDYHGTRNSNYRRNNSNRNALRNTCRVQRHSMYEAVSLNAIMTHELQRL